MAQMPANKYPATRAKLVDETELGEETFAEQCPFTVEQVLDAKYWGGVSAIDIRLPFLILSGVSTPLLRFRISRATDGSYE